MKWKLAAAALLLLCLCACRTDSPDAVPGTAAPSAGTTAPSSAGTAAVPTAPAESAEPIFTAESYPRVDGSTVTIPLSVAFYSRTAGATEEEARLHIKHNTTHSAYVNLCGGDADLIFVTYPSEDELALAQDAGIEYEIVPIVRDAFVFLVNTGNPVDSLTADEIRSIYAGRTTDWSEVGGAPGAIIPYQRPVNSGSQTGMLTLVMGGEPMMDAPTELRPSEMGNLIEAVSSYDNAERAVGYSYYYYARLMYSRDNTKFLSVDGVAPTDDAIRSDEYPFTTAYYAVLDRAAPEDAPARQLLSWILSDAGQKTAEEAGYVPVR